MTTLLAHRGASHAAPENTLAAFALAFDEGADGLECDVRLTSDGVPVVFHDADLERMTGVPGKVDQTSAARIAELSASGQGIPTLADLVNFLVDRPATILNVELKPTTRPRELAAACRPLLLEAARAHTVLVSSFDPRVLVALADAGLVLALLFDDPSALRALPLLPPVDLHPSAALITAEAIVRWAEVAPGSTVRAWTVDDVATARRLAGLGVTTLITNRPGDLRAELRAQPAGPESS